MKHHFMILESSEFKCKNTEVTLPLHSHIQNIRIYRHITLLSWQPKIPIKCIGEYGPSMQHLKWLSYHNSLLSRLNILEIYLLMFWKLRL